MNNRIKRIIISDVFESYDSRNHYDDFAYLRDYLEGEDGYSDDMDIGAIIFELKNECINQFKD